MLHKLEKMLGLPEDSLEYEEEVLKDNPKKWYTVDELVEEFEREFPEEMEAARKYLQDNRDKILSELIVVPLRWDDDKQVFVEEEE